MEDIKKLKKLYEEYKNLGKKPKKMWKGGMYSDGFADGGQVNQDQNSDPILNVIHAIGKKFSTPKASPSPSPSSSLDQQYAKIRDQQESDRERTAEDSYSDGGRVPGSFSGKMYADGGEVQDDSDDSQDSPGLSPEQFQQHLQNLKDQGYNLNDVTGDNQVVTANIPKPTNQVQPASEEDVSDVNPDDEALEQQMGNEDLQAQMESDKGSDAQQALADLDDDKLDELHAHVQAEKDKREGKDKEAESEEDKAIEDKMAAEEQTAQEKAPQESTSGARLVAALNPNDEDKDQEEPEQQSSLQQQLAKAQQQRENMLTADRLSRADELLAAGIAGHGASPASPAYINNSALAQAPVQNLQEKLALQQDDPKSQMSQVVRDYMTSKGLPVPQNASASDLFKVAPFLQKDAALQNAIQKVLLQQQGAQGRNAATNLNRQQIADANRKAAMERQLTANDAKIKAAAAGQEAKQAKEERDATVKAETDINSTRGKQALMLAQRNLMAVKNAQKMLQEFPDTNKWTAQQVALFNSEIAKIATNGVPTEGMVNELTNPTAAASMSKLASKIINVPVGAQQGKFIALNKQYLDGLSDVANQTIRDNLGNTIKSYQPKLGNDAYKNLVYRHSDMLGLFSPAEERGIGAVMKAKGLSRQDAIKALIQEKVLKDVNY